MLALAEPAAERVAVRLVLLRRWLVRGRLLRWRRLNRRGLLPVVGRGLLLRIPIILRGKLVPVVGRLVGRGVLLLRRVLVLVVLRHAHGLFYFNLATHALSKTATDVGKNTSALLNSQTNTQQGRQLSHTQHLRMAYNAKGVPGVLEGTAAPGQGPAQGC